MWLKNQLLKYEYLEPTEVKLELLIDTKSGINYGLGHISFKIGDI